ncbi:BMP family ABC transporter substrate-binding protein [Bacillus sp. P14.5]|uniref:BMP family ABC transporter substrate-binding protein n=1 Tax=Bacillus sp. P14.5 TaxID=1983400 RepID=UPI000DEB5F3D|nr:BMP family ABC transporter substrate-binding protein [Bacillus sp. P14.5]
MHQAKQLKMISIIAGTVFLIFILIVGLKAKAILKSTIEHSEHAKPVTILTSDVVTDQSWGSLAYKGKLKVEEQFPVKVNLISELTEEIETKAAIQEAAESGAKLIIGHGREFSGVFAVMAPKFPGVRFVTLHGEAKVPNQTVYTFDQGEVEYFAALSASMITKSGKIGLLDPYEARKRNQSFEMGLKHYMPEAEFFYETVGSRDDGEKAVKQAGMMAENGVDVIYAKGNSYNRDVIQYAKEKGIYVIGYLDDQSYMGRKTVLTSVLNDIPQAYTAIIDDFLSKEGIASGTVMLDESDGVYKLAPFGPMFTNREKESIETEMKRYKDGEFTFQKLK